MDLNDRRVLKELDPQGILTLTEAFPSQYGEAFSIARDAKMRVPETRPGVVALAGMGGSAVGGDLVRALFEAQGTAPFVVVRDYNLPNYIGVGDLVFCASYSGDTEETLSAYDAARRAGARIVAVTSGGELKRRAEADGNDVLFVPEGFPPRTALGYMTVPVVFACERLKLIPEQDHRSMHRLLESCAMDWGVEAADNPAKALAREMRGALPILYGLGTWQGVVANRWRCQINENAKQLAFANAYPELDHNEVMGWIGAQNQGVGRFVGVVLEDGEESIRMRTRARVTEKLLGEVISFHHVRGRGETPYERMLTLTYLGDWVSLYLARLNGVDPGSIDRIDRLKEELKTLE